MTLSLDDVRNKRFRMARKSGYEVLEVDEFVDEVEETFAQLFEENTNLKKQVGALKSTTAPAASAPAPAPQQSQPAPPAPAAAAPTAPVAAAPTAPVAAAPAAPAKPVVPGAVVVTTSKEASSAVVRLVQLSTEQAERLVEEATADASRIREEANRTAHQVTTDARTRAERVESEARVKAEGLQADALSRTEKLDREIGSRRTQMFGALEKQRDELTSSVAALRTFEATYRANLTQHLRNQIKSLETGRAEPSDAPEAVRPTQRQVSGSPAQAEADAGSEASRVDDAHTTGGGTSDTPRLDALLGDQR